jgi:outer membrane immunogenic protein
MRKLFAATFAIAALAVAPALAADLPARPVYKGAAPAIVEAGYNWSGFYIGVNGGYGWSTSDWVSVGGVNAHPEGRGGLVGGTVGINWQMSNIVLGLEGDYDWARVQGSGAWSTAGFTATSNMTYFATARGRLGLAANNALFYITGGAAFAGFDYTTTPCGCIGTFSDSRTGWTFGGGLEYGFAPNLSFKAEYLYADFGTRTSGAGVLDAVATDLRNRVSIVRGGINWRFGGVGGPVVARY